MQRTLAVLLIIISFTVFASAEIPSAGLILHYPVDGNALDASGQNNHGTVNTATLTTSRFGQAASAYRFTGRGGFIQSARALPDSTSVTISVWVALNSWVELNNVLAPQMIFFEGDDGAGHDLACFVMGGFHFSLKNDQGVSYTNWLPRVGSWIHLICVADAATDKMAIWVDGEKRAEAQFSTVANVGYHAPFNLGRRPGNYNDWLFSGMIDQVRVYNRALSEVEIQTLHALERGVMHPIEIAIEAASVTMKTVPGNTYLLQFSSDLKSWENSDAPFVATAVEYRTRVMFSDAGKFWRFLQQP